MLRIFAALTQTVLRLVDQDGTKVALAVLAGVRVVLTEGLTATGRVRAGAEGFLDR
jgi:hypothetical protein